MIDSPPSNSGTPDLRTSLDPPETDSQQAAYASLGPQPAPHPDREPPYLSDQSFQDVLRQRDLATTEQTVTCPHSLSVTFRHSGWEHNRLLIYRSLRRTDQPQSRQANYANCGSDAYILRSLDNPNIYRLAGSSCHDRFCQPCAQERSQAIALNVLELTDNRTIRFLTLTLKSSADPLSVQLDKLYTSFQALRRRQLWKSKVVGGVAFLEVTYSKDNESWHPHFHILIEGYYLPHQKLKRIWYEITGDSYIVDIRPVNDRRTAAKYVTKYAAKPFNNTFLNRPDPLDEAILAFKGRKLLLTFGTWRGITLIRTPSEGSWEHVAPLETIITNAAHGDPEANHILRCLTDRELAPLFARAPPLPPVLPAKSPNISQLTWFAVWQADGTCQYPAQHTETTT